MKKNLMRVIVIAALIMALYVVPAGALEYKYMKI